MRAGDLLDIWTEVNEEGQRRRVALAMNPRKVRKALVVLYPDSLDVIESTRRPDELSRIVQELRKTGLLTSFGNARGDDRQLVVTATLWHLPANVASDMRSYAAALQLDVLVKPERR